MKNILFELFIVIFFQKNLTFYYFIFDDDRLCNILILEPKNPRIY